MVCMVWWLKICPIWLEDREKVRKYIEQELWAEKTKRIGWVGMLIHQLTLIHQVILIHLYMLISFNGPRVNMRLNPNLEYLLDESGAMLTPPWWSCFSLQGFYLLHVAISVIYAAYMYCITLVCSMNILFVLCRSTYVLVVVPHHKVKPRTSTKVLWSLGCKKVF